MLEYIDHGDWVAYRPEKHWLFDHNPRVMFCKRVSDGVDWYDYRREVGIATSVSLKMTLKQFEGRWQVMTTNREGEMIWPENTKLIEFDYDGEDHERLWRKFFDLKTREFTDPEPMSERPFVEALAKELGVDQDKLIKFLEGSRHG
jgi:hypothetical protein